MDVNFGTDGDILSFQRCHYYTDRSVSISIYY